MPSLRQFSKLAGVSPATVSRVFSNPASVAPETQRRIIELAESVGFRPSAVANAAFGRKTRSVGVLLPVLRVSFFADIASGIQQRLLQDNYLPLLLEFGDSGEQQAIRRLTDHRPDALIMHLVDERLHPDDLMEVLRARIPLVLLGPTHANLTADTVDNDNYEGGRIAGQHLCELGHRRIGFCYFGAGHSPADERLAGFREALARYDCQVARNHIVELPPYAKPETGMQLFEENLERLLKSPDRPSAIFAAMDPLVMSIYRVARRLKLRIPRDLSVVGFANLSVTEFMDPPLTTIDQDGVEVGARAAQVALDRLTDPTRPLQNVRVGVRLVERQSTAAPAK